MDVSADAAPRHAPAGGAAGAAAPVVVYTAITAGYDDLKDPPPGAREGARFVAFLEEPLASEAWLRQPIHAGFEDPVRNAKIHKILSHRFLPEAEYSLWIDGSVTLQLTHRVDRLVDELLGDRDLVVFRHRQRTCVYQEAAVCLQRELDDPEVIWQQVCRYSAEGYPTNAGLGECPVILRRHSPAVRAFNEAWWDEICRGSRRDQLSFDYVARRTGLAYGVFPGTISVNPLFRRGPHREPRTVLQPWEVAAARAQAAPRTLTYRPPRAAAAPRRRTVAFGPIRAVPSWSWAGFDIARALGRWYDVVIHDRLDTPPACDVSVLVKRRPDPAYLDAARRRGTRVVYCPVDVYASAAEIAQDAETLRACALVLAHSERLLPLLRAHGARAELVEHHARHALREPAPFRADGFVLWVGGCQFVPYLLQWLQAHPLPEELRLLTDLDNPHARRRGRALAATIGVAFDPSGDETAIAGLPVYRWSERRQEELLRACRAAIDIKHPMDFNQLHKPPTKAQQFVASGIPLAVNPESGSAEYFRARGFALATPDDRERWLSRDYWEATRAAAARLRAATSLDAVAARYRALIEAP